MSMSKDKLIEKLSGKACEVFLHNQYLDVCDVIKLAREDPLIKSYLDKYDDHEQKVIVGKSADSFIDYRSHILKEFRKVHSNIFYQRKSLTLSEGGLKV